MDDRGDAPFIAELERALASCAREERKFVLVGVLNRHLPRRGRAVLVGGGAVELYTVGAYVTGDVDLVGDREAIVRLLTEAGFEQSGRVFVREDLEFAVDVPGSTLRPGETVIDVEVGGYRVPVVSVEDAVVDRLLAAKFWDSRTDWEQAVLLVRAHRADLDRGALSRKARANEVDDWLQDLLAEIFGRGPVR